MTVSDYVKKVHAGQMYGKRPFWYHPQAVSHVLERFRIAHSTPEGAILHAAAWLHDVLEDTPTTYNELGYLFGWQITGLVLLVTNNAEGKNRAERNEKYLLKVREGGTDSIIIKLADRIANVEESLYDGHLLGMYIKEYPRFREILRRENMTKTESRMWDWLDILHEEGQKRLDGKYYA